MKRMLVWLSLILALATGAVAQNAPQDQDRLVIGNGQTWIRAVPFAVNFRLGISPGGTTSRIIVKGCMAEGSTPCEFAGIWDGTTAGDLQLFGFWDQLQITGVGSADMATLVKVKWTDTENWAAQTAYTPAQMGMSGVTLPASTNTSTSSIISLVNVRAVTIFYTCTQAAKLNINYIAEDGTTTLRTDPLTTGITTPANYAIYNTQASVTAITNDVAGTGKFILPGNAVSFFLTNNTATPGTCTMRTVTQY